MGANSAKHQLISTVEIASPQAIIDEFGELKRAEAAFQPKMQRLKLLRDTIAGWVPTDSLSDQPITFEGKLYTVNCSPQQIERKIRSMTKLYTTLGRAKFFELCVIAIGALEDALGKTVAASWLVSERTGPRNITAVANASPAAQETA